MPAPEYFDEPHACPWCGQTEPNAFFLENNHWVKTPRGSGFDWCGTNGLCIAMDLTRNHVLFYARRLTDPSSSQPSELCACSSSRHAPRAECARVGLARCIARAEQVWPLPRRGWLEEYRALTRDLEAPEHHTVHVGEQLDLLAGV